MQKHPSGETVRRSVAIPADLLRELTTYAPEKLRGNMNQLMITAVREYIERAKAAEFERDMVAMASDKAMAGECKAIETEFNVTDGDGLGAIP